MSSDSNNPISPVARRAPDLTLSVSAINDQPVELEGTPTSPEKARRGSRAATMESLENMSPSERERREQLVSERKADAAVMQDIPQTPNAEELEKAGASDTVKDGSKKS